MSHESDSKAAALFAFNVWKYKEGQLVSLMMHIGDRLGIYRHMDGLGPTTAAELSKELALQERWILEWFRGQAAAGLLERGPDDTYELSDIGAEVLAREDSSLIFAAGAMNAPTSPDVIDQLMESFRSGKGITWNEHGSEQAANMDRMLGVWTRRALLSKVIPTFADVEAALEMGIEVLEIGCGAGAPMIVLAEAFPKSRFTGVDPSTHAIDMGNAKIAGQGLSNVELVAGYGETFESPSRYGLVLTFDCLHDMPRPDLAMQNIRKHIADDGAWLVKEIRCGDSFEENSKNPVLALMYGFSVTGCLSSSLSQPDGLGLGTLGLPPSLLKEMTEQAGFTSFEIHDFEEPANLYYEIRP